MITIDLNSILTPSTFDTNNGTSVKEFPFISENCGKGSLGLDVEDCEILCNPYIDSDEFYFQIFTGFNITYIGWEIEIKNSFGVVVWSSTLATAGIAGQVTPTTPIFFRRTYRNGQAVDFFKFPASFFDGQKVTIEIKYYDKGINGLSEPVLLSEYKSWEFCKEVCNTLLMSSEYDRTDCENNIYNLQPIEIVQFTEQAHPNTNQQSFRNVFRFRMGLEKTNYDYEERSYTSRGKLASFVSNKKYTLKGTLTETQVDFLWNILSGKNLTVNGNGYRFEGDLDKNNEDNGLWIVETELINKCNKSNLC